jgi:hypothetical protein
MLPAEGQKRSILKTCACICLVMPEAGEGGCWRVGSEFGEIGEMPCFHLTKAGIAASLP